MQLKISIVVFGVLFTLSEISCTNKSNVNKLENPTEIIVVSTNIETVQNTSSEQTPTEVALNFINSYVENCNKIKEALAAIDWVNANTSTTQHFKTQLKEMEDKAFELEPAVGLDADPIFNAQYYPEEGFELESYDKQNNYIILRGKVIQNSN